MLITHLLTLFLGINLGLLLTAIITLYLFKIKCPNCKQLRPLQEIIFFHLKSRIITGQPCPRCQRPQPQVSIEL